MFELTTEYANDAERLKNKRVTIQIVARPFVDEELIGVTEVVDNIVNKP